MYLLYGRYIIGLERYENSEKFTRFSEEQLAEIRKIKLSKIICTNADEITRIQKEALDMQDQFL